MSFTRRLLATALVLVAGVALPAAAQSSTTTIDIPYQKFVLKNGLTVLVHEDHKAPIVAVNIWYHVGSKNEKPGRTGFAHLFEHLMFNGSENYNHDFFDPFEKAGATNQNGTTNEDRTNYFENVPTPAVDMALWMESDRMGHLVGAIDTAKLNEQRGVVQNEKRQGENQPYGKTDELITAATWPATHPYSWTVIGSMEDLDAASLEDVRQWFKTYYGPANAVLAIAGDIDAATARQKAEQYFGDIPSGPPISKQDVWIAKRTGEHRQVMQDRVPQARLYKVWNIPQYGDAQARYLDLVSDVLGAGKTSRLYKRLVYDDQIATDVAAYVDLREIGGQFYIRATARPGQDLSAVEKAVDEELARFLKEGPTAEEMSRIKTQFRARFVRGVEQIGGFGGKSDVLAQNQVYMNDPSFYKTTLDRVANATADDLAGAARDWLSDGVYVLEVHPFPNYATTASTVDRSKLPDIGASPKVAFPTLERATLSNGLKIVFAKRDAVPVVNLTLLVDAGYAADQFGKPGTASLAMNMLDEGTKSRNALQISEELAQLGANLGTGSSLDMSQVSLSALKSNLDQSLALYADVILSPSFPADEFDRLQKQQLARIQREKVTPLQMALRVFPRLLYGEGHAYGNSYTGTGTEASVSSMATSDLQKFHNTWFKPNNATLVVVGNTTMNEIRPKLEKLFSGWKRGEVPKKNLATVKMPDKPVVYLIDRPGSDQSIIFAGNVAPPKANPDEIGIDVMNDILGGKFGSRVNMNLREDKHWAYGAFTLLLDARGQRPFIAYAPVQTDKTAESMAEVQKELEGILGQRPVTADELTTAKANLTLTLPGRWETMGAVGGSINEIVTFGLDDRYWDTYGAKVDALRAADVVPAAKKVVAPSHLVWVIVGDREKIEDKVRALNLGEVRFLDADGKPAGETAGR